jgi:hypothetical protein
MGIFSMAKINRLLVGELLVGDGNEVAHIDLIIGPRGSPAESAFARALTNNKDGFTTLLAVVAPNLLVKPATSFSTRLPSRMRRRPCRCSVRLSMALPRLSLTASRRASFRSAKRTIYLFASACNAPLDDRIYAKTNGRQRTFDLPSSAKSQACLASASSSFESPALTSTMDFFTWSRFLTISSPRSASSS